MEGEHTRPLGIPEVPGTAQPAPADPAATLPVMPGFREMAIRRHADERAALMAEDRGRLVRQLAEQRQAAGLSQTEVAALMGTSQSAVARIESGTADVRASTLERYAAAVGSQIAWHLDHPAERAEGTQETPSRMTQHAPTSHCRARRPARGIPAYPAPTRDQACRVWPDPKADWRTTL